MKGNHKSKGPPVKIGKPGIPQSRGKQQRRKAKGAGCSTPGHTKSASCKASWRQRGWARRARSYKEKDFATIGAQMKRKAVGDMVKG